MKGLLDEAMNDGAFGLSTMLADSQERVSTTDDLVTLAGIVHEHGGL